MLISGLFGGAAALAQQAVIHDETPSLQPELRSGPSVGLSLGAATGVGPTLGVPLGRSLDAQLTLLPIVIPDAGAGGSYGLRFRQFIGKNPRSRLYLVQGASATGLGPDWLWGAGVGAGVEVRRDPTTGFTPWFDVTVTALGTGEGPLVVLPLPQAGVAWVF
jgi:hypothetical protein